jgi:tetratricopeptide (TPR) repeat protein
MQCPEVQAGQQAQGGSKIEAIRRRGIFLVPFLAVFFFLLTIPSQLPAAQSKAKKQPAERQARSSKASAPALPSVNDVNVGDHFRSGEELVKKGKHDDALKVFRAVYDYAEDVLALMTCVKSGYDSALAQSSEIDQNTKEDLFLKLRKISSLAERYTGLKGESAYRMAVIYQAKGRAGQARKYFLEVCQTAPFSLDPESTWMKAKEALLSLSHLEGEF